MADASCGARVVMLTTFDMDEYVYEALKAGASGFLLKDVQPELLVAGIRAVHGGVVCAWRDGAPGPPRALGLPARERAPRAVEETPAQQAGDRQHGDCPRTLAGRHPYHAWTVTRTSAERLIKMEPAV